MWGLRSRVWRLGVGGRCLRFGVLVMRFKVRGFVYAVQGSGFLGLRFGVYWHMTESATQSKKNFQ